MFAILCEISYNSDRKCYKIVKQKVIFISQKAGKLMDRTDSEILFLLQRNARMSLSEISTHVNLSVSAVSERLKKLEQSGLILRYTSVLNPEMFGKTLQVFVPLELLPSHDSQVLEAIIENESDILEYHRLVGGGHALLKIVTKSIDTLEAILTKIRSVDGVRPLYANMIASSPKCNPSVPPIMD